LGRIYIIKYQNLKIKYIIILNMSAYPAPTEDITEFNTSLFNQPEDTLSQAEADRLYLSKTSNDTSSASLTTFNGVVTINGNSSVGTNGSSNDLSIKGEQRFYNTSSPYLTYAKISTSGSNVIYESPNALTGDTTHQFKTYTGGALLSLSGFEIQPAQNVSRVPLVLTNRLQFGATSTYSFPLNSTTILGYYLKATGSISTPTFQSATITNLVTTTSLPIGVWRFDFSVQNVVGASGAGTITSSQSYIALSATAGVASALASTGAVLRSHISEVYGNNDIQVITSSFTYAQTSAVPLYLNIVRSFATGSYTFNGEVAVTRLA
jgi:hypothetical protein